MKKLFLILVGFAFIIGMTACSNKGQETITFNYSNSDDQEANENNNQDNNGADLEANKENENNNELESQNDDENEDNEIEQDKSKDEEDEEVRTVPEELVDYEEGSALTNEIDVNQLTANVQTDNQNNRVIIFSNEQKEKRYKSIYLKRKDRLKIIDLDEDKQIFNEVIR